MNRKKFAKDSPIWQQDLYGLGVMASLITTDGFTVLPQSSKFNKDSFATAAGMVTKRENVFLSQLIEQTAQEEELLEELLWDKNLIARASFNIISVSAVGFRKSTEGRGFFEFFIPIQLNCDKAYLTKIIQTNEAPDRREHTGIFRFIDLKPENRTEANYDEWTKITPGGRGLYPTVVQQAARFFNMSTHGDFIQRFMPYSRSENLFISFFNPNPLTKDLKSNYKSEELKEKQLAIKK